MTILNKFCHLINWRVSYLFIYLIFFVCLQILEFFFHAFQIIFSLLNWFLPSALLWFWFVGFEFLFICFFLFNSIQKFLNIWLIYLLITNNIWPASLNWLCLQLKFFMSLRFFFLCFSILNSIEICCFHLFFLFPLKVFSSLTNLFLRQIKYWSIVSFLFIN